MRPFPGRLALALAFISSVLVGSALVLAPGFVHATDPAPDTAQGPSTCPCPATPEDTRPSLRPRYADAAPPRLDISDEAATLEAVHVALSELGDGASYVWQRRGSKLSGIISPTTSFKDAQGRVCRHLVVTLTAGERTARTEGIACRMADKSWRLEG
jgi:hypothetical protein